jgi:hypothetical protein
MIRGDLVDELSSKERQYKWVSIPWIVRQGPLLHFLGYDLVAGYASTVHQSRRHIERSCSSV